MLNTKTKTENTQLTHKKAQGSENVVESFFNSFCSLFGRCAPDVQTSSSSKINHEVKAWAGITKHAGYITRSIFEGKSNRIYEDPLGLILDITFYESRYEAAHRHYLFGKDNVYILEFGYNKFEIEELTKKGCFHQTIIRAIQCRPQFDAFHGAKKQSEVPVIENPNYNPDLLKLEPSSTPGFSQGQS